MLYIGNISIKEISQEELKYATLHKEKGYMIGYDATLHDKQANPDVKHLIPTVGFFKDIGMVGVNC